MTWFKPTAQSGGFSLITNGLVSRYTFEGTGDTTTLTDTEGTSDMNLTGMTYGSSSTGRPTSVTGDSYGDFTGTDDNARLQRDLPNTSAWTFICWVYTRTITDYSVLWGQLENNTPTNKSGPSFNNNGEIRATTNGVDGFTTARGPTVQTGEWALAAAIFDGGNELRIRYRDSRGETTNATGVQMSDSSSFIDFVIGQGVGRELETHDGLIDDARHYNRAITGSEFTDIFNGNG